MIKLISYDFDDTLFHTPLPEVGKDIWMEKKGIKWPHRGWWGKPESLDSDVFEIAKNEWVYQHYLEHREDINSHLILATGRLNSVEGMRENVERILEKNDITFDGVYLNWGGDTLKFKIQLFERLITFIKPDEFIMFDDRQPHLEEFKKWSKNQDVSIVIMDAINKNIYFKNKN